MRPQILSGALALAVIATQAWWAKLAQADEVVASETTSYYAGPNRSLLWSGIVASGVPYIASIIVASESSHPGDSALYAPVAGPWIDLVQRGGCPVANTSCNGETVAKAFLVGDGILQGVGALAIVSSFLVPEHSRRSRHYADLHFTPLSLSTHGGGLAALGTF
jgi:hypothetical protein